MKKDAAQDTAIEKIYSLSPMQEGILFHTLKNVNSQVYFEQVILQMNGIIDKKLLEESVNELICRHEVLRTLFVYQGMDEPRQVVLKKRPVSIQYIDLSPKDDKEADDVQTREFLGSFLEADRKRGFRLDRDPLIRVVLFHLSQEESQIIISYHHILMDGWSLAIVLRELSSIYCDLANKRIPVPKRRNSYQEYIKWYRQQDFTAALAFWQEYLGQFESATPVPVTFSRQKDRALKADEDQILGNLTFTVGESMKKELESLAVKTGVTLHTVLLSIWGVILQKYHDAEDVVFGTVLSGRHSDIEGIGQMVGLFMNTIPVRVKTGENRTFSDLIKAMQVFALEAKEFDYVPLARIQSGSVLKSNLLDHLLVFENYPSHIKETEDSEFFIRDCAVWEQSGHPFTMVVLPDSEMTVMIKYNRDVYADIFIHNISGHIMRVIREIVANPLAEIRGITLLDSREEKKVIKEFNAIDRDVREDTECRQTMAEIFEETARRYPNQTAVIYQEEQISYDELNSKANQLARILTRSGVMREVIVPVIMEQNVDMIIALLGILKAGGAYLPVGSNYPAAKVREILADCNAKIIISKSHRREELEYKGVLIDVTEQNLAAEVSANLERRNTEKDLAYVIYTSGTTGKSKGVMIEQKSIANVIKWRNNEFQSGVGDTALQLISYSFDAFLVSFFAPIVSGAKVILAAEDERNDAHKIIQLIRKYQVSHLTIVPSLYGAILKDMSQEDMRSLRRLALGGEQASAEMIKLSKSLNPYMEIVNEYGPTENTVMSIVQRNMREETTAVIGRPIPGTQAYILNKAMLPVPIGIAGELCLSGLGIARGYLNQEDLTNEVFVPHPFIPNERLYKTGDMARWMPDGQIEYMGRIDRQVKIRGHRIELKEVESQLLKLHGVNEAAVIEIENVHKEKDLCAYVVVSSDTSADQLRDILRQRISDYMVPAYFVVLDRIPLTETGKLDQRSLPAPDLSKGEECYVAPQTETEHILCEIWEAVLGYGQVGLEDNFFHLGGDSIKAIQIVSRAGKYGLKIDVGHIFEAYTIKNLARYVKTATQHENQGIVEGKIQLTPIQKWFFEQQFEHLNQFNQGFLLRSRISLEIALVDRVLAKLTEHHDALRMIYTEKEDVTIQWNQGPDKKTYDIQQYNLKAGAALPDQIKNIIDPLQRNFDLKRGPLIRVAILCSQQEYYLFIVMHHLIIDMVSWRILLEDLSIGYDQASAQKDITFQAKTNSFMSWSESLYEYANDPALLSELKYWDTVCGAPVTSLKKRKTDKISRYRDTNMYAVQLSAEKTNMLLQDINHTYHTEIKDILLAALGLALYEWTGAETVLINLEGHGREEIIENSNITRTVGWFTSTYPFLLNNANVMKGTDQIDLSNYIKQIKEDIRKIPNRGIGYGILRYITDISYKRKFNIICCPEISFNYLGQMDTENPNHIFEIVEIPQEAVHPDNHILHAVDIVGMIFQGRLQMEFRYGKEEFEQADISFLAHRYIIQLEKLIEHCFAQNNSEFTPSDYDDSNLSLEELDFITDLF